MQHYYPNRSKGPSREEYFLGGAAMLLTRKTFFIKEHVALLKLTDTYDIIDPETNQKIGIAKEEPHPIFKFLRLLVSKSFLPTTISIYEDEHQPPVLSINKPFSLFPSQSKVSVMDQNGVSLGYFKSKLFSLGGSFLVFDTQDNQVAEINGDWKGWNFKFVGKNGEEWGTVTKKWAGIGKELFTSADNYMISIGNVPSNETTVNSLLLAAGLAIDIILKEKG